jgi:GNAT superfamily N-acetyltransferase
LRLTLRDADPGAAPLLSEMNLRLIEDEHHYNPMGLPELEVRMRGWLERGEYRAALFYADSEAVSENADPESFGPAGYVLYQLRRDRYFPERVVVYVRHFYVERGRRRRGIGRLALATITRELFPADATIELEVLATNPVGREFWTSLGFQPRYTVMQRGPRS